MKRAAFSFGAMFAGLLAVALSVPIGTPDALGLRLSFCSGAYRFL